MEKKLTRYALHANKKISNRVFDVVEQTGIIRPLDGVSDFKEYIMVMIDCKSVSQKEITKLLPKLKKALSNNTAIMLLDPKANHKKALSELIGFSNQLESAAFFVAPTKDLFDRENYKIHEQAYPITNESSIVSSVEFNAIKGVMTSKVSKVKIKPTKLTLSAQACLAFSRALHETLNRIHIGEVLKTEGSSAPQDAPHKLWSYTINHNFHPNASTGGKYTPPIGDIVLSGTSEIGVYLDNIHVNQSFFYVKVITSALCSPNAQFLSETRTGWVLGGIEFTGSPITGLTHVSSSPANVNNETDYTASSSFTVGVSAGTDGASGNFSYTESNSVTKSITDWEILQLSTNQWNFAQQEPFNGENPLKKSGSNPVWVKAVNSKGEITNLPSITRGGLTINTQSIWRTDGLPTNTQDFDIAWNVFPLFINMDKTGKSWHGWGWGGWTLGAGDVWSIDYSKITWTGPR